MTKRWFVLAVMTLLSAATAHAQIEDRFHWDGQLASGGAVEVRGINGDITATPGTGARVEVEAIKRGEDDDPRDVSIEVVEDSEGVLICAVYPSEDRDEPNRCRRGENRSSVRDNDVDVDFRVVVPSGARFVGRTVNGEVRATGLSGEVDAATVNGPVTVATTGTAKAHTVNGSIDVATGQASWSGVREFQTVNGSITLELPSATRAAVRGKIVNGDLDSDFPLTLEANNEWGPKQFEGTIGGGGGGRIDLETVNGSIRLRRAN
jgi:hypothetical protein